ncbi:MAG: hypothetical protein AB4040_06055 [Synechococcus sp.]
MTSRSSVEATQLELSSSPILFELLRLRGSFYLTCLYRKRFLAEVSHVDGVINLGSVDIFRPPRLLGNPLYR